MPRLPAPPAPFPAQIAATAHTYLDRLDDHVVLTGEEGHHLQRVRRVREGEIVTGADGWGRWRVYEVAGSQAPVSSCSTRAPSSRTSRTSCPRSPWRSSLTKGEKPELVVQKLTELGVDRIVLVAAARSVVRWDDAKAAANLERLRRVAREAGQQCRRARLPEVDGPVTPAELAGHPGLVVAGPDGVPGARAALPPGRRVAGGGGARGRVRRRRARRGSGMRPAWRSAASCSGPRPRPSPWPRRSPGTATGLKPDEPVRYRSTLVAV